jgi:hypothetical protein
MKKTKQPPVKRYVAKLPSVIPADMVLVHNHVRPEGFPDIPLDFNGFRAWLQSGSIDDPPLVACTCGWAPKLGQHFRVNRDKLDEKMDEGVCPACLGKLALRKQLDGSLRCRFCHYRRKQSKKK